MTDTEKLAELARAAISGSGPADAVRPRRPVGLPLVAYIDPQTILALIEERDELRRRNDRLMQWEDTPNPDTVDLLTDARARIEAAIAEEERWDVAPSAMSQIHQKAGKVAGLCLALELLEGE